MKRLFFIFLIGITFFILSCSTPPTTTSDENKSSVVNDNKNEENKTGVSFFKFSSSNESATIIGLAEKSLSTNYFTIPKGAFQGKQITRIGSQAFKNYRNITSVIIYDNIVSIGPSAFEDCYNLTSITIPNSVTSIDFSAFKGCINLTSITIPNGVTSIDSSAFRGCTNLASIKIPNSVIIIGSSAFEDCNNLTSIVIPDTVAKIDDSAFKNCENLIGITIPVGITYIGNRAFLNCPKLTVVMTEDGVITLDFYGDDVFKNCSNLNNNGISSNLLSAITLLKEKHEKRELAERIISKTFGSNPYNSRVSVEAFRNYHILGYFNQQKQNIYFSEGDYIIIPTYYLAVRETSRNYGGYLYLVSFGRQSLCFGIRSNRRVEDVFGILYPSGGVYQAVQDRNLILKYIGNGSYTENGIYTRDCFVFDHVSESEYNKYKRKVDDIISDIRENPDKYIYLLK